MELDNSKISTELNLSLNTPLEERVKGLDLNVGYISDTDEWELIVKHTGNLEDVRERLGFNYISLLNGYAVIRIKTALIGELSFSPEIIYIEKPKSMFEEATRLIEGFSASCMGFLNRDDNNLSGRGVLVSVIDSGIDYRHPVFWNGDNTKIIEIWDQSQSGNPPDKYKIGSIYTREDVENAGKMGNVRLNTVDVSGHGTAVSSIVANIAPQADLLIVKLDTTGVNGLPTTSALMLAIDYSINYAIKNNTPIVINLSFGNNYGDHGSNSILEDYIDSVSGIYKMSIAVGTGNDGDAGRHSQFLLGDTTWKQIEFAVDEYETGINLQIWRNYSDTIEIVIRTPSGKDIGPISPYQNIMEYRVDHMSILAINGTPSPINSNQETYISIIPQNKYIESGIWSVFIHPKSISQGRVDIWLPVRGSTSSMVRFLNPSEFTTLTIPSTARRVISVGAYDSTTETYGAFSGRGYTVYNEVKPDIAAPGVNIDVAIPGGGYGKATGTSFATPFVSGGIAIMMENGIVNGNDPFMYGEKVKAYIIKGARKLPGYKVWPNEKLGWGAFCLEKSMI